MDFGTVDQFEENSSWASEENCLHNLPLLYHTFQKRSIARAHRGKTSGSASADPGCAFVVMCNREK